MSVVHANLTVPTYRDRLRLEGTVLAACSAIAVVILLVATGVMPDLLFAIQLAFGVGLLALLGPRFARKAMAQAEPVGAARAGSGEPTPVWHLVAIVAVATPLFGLAIDALSALSFASGAGLVGLAQASVIERTVAAEERRAGVAFLRRPGSRLLRGTKLGHVPAHAAT